MAITLDPTLQIAQDGDDHKMIIELIAGKATSDLPAFGNPITIDNEQDCSCPLLLNSGRLAIVYAGYGFQGDYTMLRIIISDTEKQTFDNYISVNNVAGRMIEAVDAIVLDSNDNIGVAWTRRWDSTIHIMAEKVSSTGVNLGSTQLEITNTTNWESGIATVKRGDNDFALVWAEATDAVNFGFYTSTSTDYLSWSGITQLNIGGLDSTKITKDPKMIKLSNGTYFLVFSYQDTIGDAGSIYNIYYSTSTDFVTWTDAAQVTTTTEMTKDYISPDIVEQVDGSVFITTGENNTYVALGRTNVGVSSDISVGAYPHFSEATGNVYFTSGSGSTTAASIAVVDMDTFTTVKYYTRDTTPAIPAYWADSCSGSAYGAEHWVAIYSSGGICLADTTNDVIRSYYFYDQSEVYGAEAVKNVDWGAQSGGIFDETVHGCYVDTENNKIWVLLADTYLYTQFFRYGYLDLTETSPPYAFYDVGSYENYADAYQGVCNPYYVYPEYDVMVTHGITSYSTNQGYLWVWSLSEDIHLKRYYRGAYPDFPLKGFFSSAYTGDTIWALVYYDGTYATEKYKKGLAEIDLITDRIFYHECPYVDGALNEMQTMTFHADTSELIINHGDDVFVYNINTSEWSKYEYGIGDIYWNHAPIYNPTRNVFFEAQPTGSGVHTSGRYLMLPRGGTLDITKYVTGAYDTIWDFSSPETALFGFYNTQPAISIAEDNSIYFTWTNNEDTWTRINWDKTGASINLSDYLVDEVSMERSIDGGANTLSFTLSDGHLFDPMNTNSIINFYVSKGNLVTLKLGENISDVDYFVNQGTFIITELKISYQYGDYPVINVVCKDKRFLWDNHTVDVSIISEAYPEDAIKDITKSEMQMLDDSDFSLPTFADRFTFDAQWLDTPLVEIVNQIANRFGYYLTIDADDKVTARAISLTAGTDHTYSDKDKFLEFSPDDSYSDFTNRIIVVGHSLDDIQVLYDEERVAGLSGTVGWWGFNKDFKTYYSEDRSKRCKYPRLEVIETSTSIMFKLAGSITESISESDQLEHKWCIVEISAPNLIPVLLAAMAMIAVGMLAFDWATVAGTPVAQTGPSWSVGRIIANAGMIMAMMVLGSVGNYQYEVWAQPIGYVRRQVSATSNDDYLQQKLGEIILEKIEGFLCDTTLRCQDVANFEMMVTKAQRNRITTKKIGHLQDQEGDTMTFPHPYTGNQIKIFTTNLTRKYKQATVNNEGYFYDELEGWVIE